VRPTEDLDLVATFPFDLAEAERRFLPVLADASVDDGVAFDLGRVRVEGIWLLAENPGVRVFAEGAFNGWDVDFHTDITFAPYPRPGPEWVDLPTESGAVARVLACRPESVVGHKVQALWHRGLLGWRPKDLDDIRLLLDHVPLTGADLRASILAYLTDVGATAADARELFRLPWWGTKIAAARWRDFAVLSPRPGTPRLLSEVVAGVADRLAPVLEEQS
jgi:hypothetical protein